MTLFKNLYQYRELLKTNIQKEIRGKYKGSFLGVLWSFLNPLLMVLVYAIVFPYIMRVSVPNYLIFLIVGVIPWNFFVTCITTGCNCVWMNGGIIKKVYFPREILPISVVAAGLINFLISCIIILLFVIFGGIGISLQILWLPLITIIQSALSLGLLFILNLVFYATPILYTADMFPEGIRWVLYLNPMTHLVDAYRSIFYLKEMPNLSSLLYIAVLAFVILVIGYAVFKKLEKGFAEEV